MTLFRLVLLALLVLATACSKKPDYREQLALEVIEENFQTTDFSALVEVTSYVMHSSPELEAENLEAIYYSARVLDVFVGDERPEIEFVRYVEPGEDFADQDIGVEIISLCRDANGIYFVPDIGFELPAEKSLLNRARELTDPAAETAETLSENKQSICR